MTTITFQNDRKTRRHFSSDSRLTLEWVRSKEQRINPALVRHITLLSARTSKPATREEVEQILAECFDETDSPDTRAEVLCQFLPQAKGRTKETYTFKEAPSKIIG